MALKILGGGSFEPGDIVVLKSPIEGFETMLPESKRLTVVSCNQESGFTDVFYFKDNDTNQHRSSVPTVLLKLAK